MACLGVSCSCACVQFLLLSWHDPSCLHFQLWHFELCGVWTLAKHLARIALLVLSCNVFHDLHNCEETHTICVKLVQIGTTSASWMVQIVLGARFEIKTTQKTHKAITRSNSNATATTEMCDRGSAELHSVNFRCGRHADSHVFHEPISMAVAEVGIGTLMCSGTCGCIHSRAGL